jgi:hypothetical protein
VRDKATRKADALEMLEKQGHMWLSTADRYGKPHLIAVSAWWDGRDMVIATTGESRTAANLAPGNEARLAAGTPEDVVMVDTEVIESVPAGEADQVAAGFAAAVGWDPREVGKGWVFFRLRPSRIQAYRGYDEVKGSDVMRGSTWLA